MIILLNVMASLCTLYNRVCTHTHTYIYYFFFLAFCITFNVLTVYKAGRVVLILLIGSWEAKNVSVLFSHPCDRAKPCCIHITCWHRSEGCDSCMTALLSSMLKCLPLSFRPRGCGCIALGSGPRTSRHALNSLLTVRWGICEIYFV